jgi:hypothetical protein
MSKSKTVVAIFLVSLMSLFTSACGLGQASGTLGRLQQIASTCPHGQSVAAYVGDDLSQNDRSPALTQERLAEIQSAATFTAVCGGYLQVNGFSSSDAGTQVLYSHALQMSGATLNSRLQRVTVAVNNLMNTVQANITSATKSLPSDATDIMSQFTLMQEYLQQQGPGHRLYGLLLTSGLQSVGSVVTNVKMSEATASDLGNRVPVPILPGSVLTIAGLGRVASGAPAPSGYVQSLLTFFNKACTRTGATTCTVSINPVSSIEGS